MQTILPIRHVGHSRFETIEHNTHNDVLGCVSRLKPKTDEFNAESLQIHNLTVNVKTIPKPCAASFSSRTFNTATRSSMQKLASVNAEEFLRSGHYTLVKERVHAPRTLDYIHAFPNLRHLSITDARFTEPADDDACARFATQRKANVADQDTNGMRVTFDSVAGGVLDVYTLRLRTSVTRLASMGRAEGCWDAPFAAMLDDLNPEELQVTAACGAVARCGEGFAAALCAERDWPLGTLCAVLEVGCVDILDDVHGPLETIVEAAAPPTIEELELHSDYTALHAASWDRRICIDEENVEDYLGALDLDALADDVCAHVEKVWIRLTGHPSHADISVLWTWPETHSDSDDSEDELRGRSAGNTDNTIQGLRAITTESQKALYGPRFFPYPQVEV